MTKIVVSRRDGVAREPSGTLHRIHRGKTLADADHPLVLANPNDWSPMVVELSLPTTGRATLADDGTPASPEQITQFENDVAELEETLGQRDAEMRRLADGLAEHGIELPAEDDREPGWLVDLALASLDGKTAEPVGAPAFVEPETAPVPPPRGAARARRRQTSD